MKVVPFFLTQKNGQLAMTKLTIFLAHGGKAFWQTEEETVTQQELVEQYLEVNGIVSLRIQFTQGVVFVQVDPKQTKLEDFYTWEEAYKHPQRPECWRSYSFFKDATGADWFTSKNIQEAEIEGKSIQEIYEDILNLRTL